MTFATSSGKSRDAKQDPAAAARAEQEELERLCAQAAAEVRASRKMLADYETLVANLRQQIATLKALDTNGSEQIANLERMLALASAEAVKLREIIALREGQIADYKTEVERLRKKVDDLSRGNTKTLVLVGAVALVIGTLLGITGGN